MLNTVLHQTDNVSFGKIEKKQNAIISIMLFPHHNEKLKLQITTDTFQKEKKSSMKTSKSAIRNKNPEWDKWTGRNSFATEIISAKFAFESYKSVHKDPYSLGDNLMFTPVQRSAQQTVAPEKCVLNDIAKICWRNETERRRAERVELIDGYRHLCGKLMKFVHWTCCSSSKYKQSLLFRRFGLVA